MADPFLYRPMATARPVVGELHPYVASFGEFVTADQTMAGLARYTETSTGKRLDILAMAAAIPGCGQGSAFLRACMDAYDTVAVWEILNPDLRDMLARRGFTPTREIIDGSPTEGMRWDKRHG